MPATSSSSIRSRLPALVPEVLREVGPAACALLFAGWCGSFYFGASATGAAVAHGVLVVIGAVGLAGLVGAVGGRPGSWAVRSNPFEQDPIDLDPLELGRGGRFLLPALLAVVALAWWTSPVPRAGRVGLVLLPALLVAPAVFSRAWPWRRNGPRGLVATRSVSAAVAVVSVWALISWLVGPADRPAEPLGHHLLLATWIVVLLPLALLPLGESGRRRDTGRGLAAVAGISGAVAVVATRSLAGGLALVVEAAVALWMLRRLRSAAGRPEEERSGPIERLLDAGRETGRRARIVVAVAAVLALGVAVVASWGDPSLLARWVYWRGGWEGVLERPVTGFGPGSTAWTLAAFLRPVPGVNPPSEVVGELHLLPLALAYELGLPGLALAVATMALFGWRRLRSLGIVRPADPADPADPALAVAGLTGLAGALVMGLATADWRVTAVPVAVAVAAGAALAGSGDGTSPSRKGRSGGGMVGRSVSRIVRRIGGPVVAAVYLGVAVAVLVPIDQAHRSYERAERPDQLRRAVELDPSFPLYRFQAVRAEWLAAPARGERAPSKRQIAAASAEEAQGAAEAARGVAVLWLRAGGAAAAAGQSGVAALELETACGLDPLGAMAPFNLLAIRSPLYRSEALGARALAAEPRLGAALLWRERPELLDRSLAALAAADGIDPGWRQEVVARIRALRDEVDSPLPRQEATVSLVVDAHPASSLSLHTFRRLPRRVELSPVPVDRQAAQELSAFPPATVLPGTDPRLFPPTCTGPFAPQTLRKTLWKTW